MIKVTTAPVLEPVTLDEAKLDLRVDHSDDDYLILNLITAARREAEQLAQRAFITQTIKLYLSAWPVGNLELPRPPLQSVTSITYTDSAGVVATVAAANYTVYTGVEPGLIALTSTGSWPSSTLMPGPSIVVTYVAGHGATPPYVPAEYRQLIRGLVALKYEAREGMTPDNQRKYDHVVAALRQDGVWL